MELMFNDMHAQVDMTQYIKDCVDVPRIIKGCQGCKNYAKLWSCPPFGFDPVKIWRDYSKLTLYARKISFPKELTEKTFDAYGLTAQYFEIWNKERRKFFVVRYWIGRPGTARRPASQISPRSSSRPTV